jgi:uncharacterized protein
MAKTETEPKGGMTVQEAGRRGGQAVKKKYGREHYERIGKMGGQATRNAYGSEFYEEIGQKGGKVSKRAS